MTAEPLNQRETQILKLVSEGNGYKKVAKIIDLEVPTIKVYIRSAKDKLGAASISHAVALFVRMLAS